MYWCLKLYSIKMTQATGYMQLFIQETMLKQMHCQMCGIYFKKKTISSCIVALIQLAWSCLWKEVQNIRKHMETLRESQNAALKTSHQLSMCQVVFKESALRPILSSSCDVSLYACLFVPFSCNLFWGLSLALRSHDQIPASHWLKS